MSDDIDFSKMHFQIDELQNQLIQRYMQEDMNFRRALSTNFTGHFLKYIDDKCRLKEPISLSVIGAVRSGKSVGSIYIAYRILMNNGQKLSAENICASEFKFLEEIQKTKKNSCYIIDESKTAVFGIGSVAKRLKLQDIQNIIAVNNISTIWIRPDRWSFEGAQYGLMAFGRCFDSKPRFNRFMLYNLQARGSAGELPLGIVYIPHFADVIPEGKQLEKDYLAKKQEWVDREQRGEADMLYNKKMEMAKSLCKNKNFLKMKNKERVVFVSSVLGSEWTKAEADEICIIARMMLEKKI